MELCRLVSVAARLPRLACVWAVGPGHKASHRMLAGSLFMAGGVLLIHAGSRFEAEALHWTFEAIGSLVHAVGAAPILEALLASED